MDRPVAMQRLTLTGIPQHPLPAGFAFRPYRPGDAAVFTELWNHADRVFDMPIEEGLFEKQFGRESEVVMARRMIFLLNPAGEEIGTITVWRKRIYGQPWGLVHWVGLRPAYQGQGLSKCMMTACLNRMRSLGHRRAYLDTQDHRLPAIRLYEKFGFEPDLRKKDAEAIWAEIRRAQGRR